MLCFTPEIYSEVDGLQNDAQFLPRELGQKVVYLHDFQREGVREQHHRTRGLRLTGDSSLREGFRCPFIAHAALFPWRSGSCYRV